MRLPLIAAALLAATAPLTVQAQDADFDTTGFTETMNDPAVQEQASEVLAVMMGMMMEMPVGQLAEATRHMGDGTGPDIGPDATVRDLLGPAGEDAPRRVARHVPQMMETMGSMAGVLEAMMPQLRDMADRLPRNLPRRD